MNNCREILEALALDNETGVLRWKSARSNRVPAGSIAGRVGHTGYRVVTFLGRGYSAHRIVWAIVHGDWPNGIVDHINRNRDDNRITNLRVVSGSENAFNSGIRKTNTVGVFGVTERNGRFLAQISAHNKKHWLGSFDTAEEAGRAYAEAKLRLHAIGGAQL